MFGEGIIVYKPSRRDDMYCPLMVLYVLVSVYVLCSPSSAISQVAKGVKE